MKISFVIPCYRSEKTVESVIDEAKLMLAQRPEFDYEIICVNDCSPDNVIDVLKKRAAEDDHIKVIDLACNVGKHGAVMAAYSVLTGDYVVGVDDDGQCPLDRLWDLIEPLENGYDMAMAQYDVKKQSGFKNFGSSVNNLMSRILIDKPADLKFTNFIARKRFVCDEMAKYKNPYPYLEGLSLRATRNIKLVPMQERSRISGSSGYNFKKSVTLWVNGFTAFSVKPLRIATIIGLLCSVVGVAGVLFLIIRKLITKAIMPGYTSTMALMLFIGGIIMMMLGLIGEYIGRIYICINHAPQYVIREMLNVDRGKNNG